ncbi:hypothetical protein KQS06HV_230199 [Klebsiella quasipneumoniae subsp. similipneumoniae]|nr:hypothetical protein KQS06HV_230199 [Klebsiella quasipneumoniae subsp. similipneumoniae]
MIGLGGGGLLRLRLVRLLILNRLRGDRCHLVGIAHGRRIGDRRQGNSLIAASLRLGLRLQIQVCFTAGGRRVLAIVRGKQNADDNQQEASNNSPAVHRGQWVQEAKMIRGVPDFRQGRCQFKAPGHGFPPAPHIFILHMSIDG